MKNIYFPWKLIIGKKTKVILKAFNLSTCIQIIKLNGSEETANPGDWVITDERGELWLLTPEIFEERYELIF